MSRPLTSDALPTISIVVPNFNGGKTLRGTLQCLIDQQYPKLEILVADGGSSDDSVEIIKSFAPHLSWWVSEKDRGQSHAINKGFDAARGDVVNWLCSDDLLEPGCLRFVGEAFADDPTLDVLAGAAVHVDTTPGGATTYSYPTMAAIEMLPIANPIPQPACFYHRRLLQRRPPIDESLHYVMDFELWCYFSSLSAHWKVTDRLLARALVDGKNKMSTGGAKIAAEMEETYLRYVKNEHIPLATLYRKFVYPLDRWRAKHPGTMTVTAVRALKMGFQLGIAPFYGYRRARSINWSAYV